MINDCEIIIVLITFLITFLITKNIINSIIYSLIIFGIIITYKKVKFYWKTHELFDATTCQGCYCMKLQNDDNIDITEMLLIGLEDLEKQRKITRTEREFIVSKIYSDDLSQPQMFNMLNSTEFYDEKTRSVMKDKITDNVNYRLSKLPNDEKEKIVKQVITWLLDDFRSKQSVAETNIIDFK